MRRPGTNLEAAVKARYETAAQNPERELCCPTSYDPKYLAPIPAEILERDYGCGDPTGFVQPGDTVLDLGSGAGKICYIAAQIAGPRGQVIGVDFNEEMLALARKHRATVARRLGYDNAVFHRARIQDLRLPLDAVESYLRKHAVRSIDDWARFQAFVADRRSRSPLIPDESVDVVLSNCVLNLVPDEDKPALFAEMHRVLRRGGRAAISDIVADEDVPDEMKADPALWSGCISGAMREDRFLGGFERAGFYGIQIEKYDEKPWRTVRGIQFRSITITARKGKEGPCLERLQAVIYKGPWKEVRDDDGHVLRRGERVAVCDKTFTILTRAPYAPDIVGVRPLREVPIRKARPFACKGLALRDPRETKGRRYQATSLPGNGACGPGCC